MSESRPNKAVTDEELIGVLTAISVVSRRLARKLIQLNQTSQSQEGGNVMSRMSEMEATIRELWDIASSINDIANWLTGAFSGSEEAAPAPEPEKALTLEEVRAILAEKSRDGFTAQIRDLLLKYGAKKLSEVDPASYKALVADAEVLGNG